MMGGLESKCRVLRTGSRCSGLANSTHLALFASPPHTVVDTYLVNCVALYKHRNLHSSLLLSFVDHLRQIQVHFSEPLSFISFHSFYGLFLPGQIKCIHPAPVLVKRQYQLFYFSKGQVGWCLRSARFRFCEPGMVYFASYIV